MTNAFALCGDILHTPVPEAFEIQQNAFLICEEHKIAGIFSEIPPAFAGIPVLHRPGTLLIPGFCDLHLHGPQHPFQGMGMDLPLLEWLEGYAFPEEKKFLSLEYAQWAYYNFTEELRKGFTTSACIFASIHVPATVLLMKMLDNAGLRAYVGKVNMDRNCPDGYRETTSQSLADTARWVAQTNGRFSLVQPIITPRFLPTCTPELLQGLSALQRQTHLPVQSHLSETVAEIQWVRSLCPDSPTYGHAYHRFGLLGSEGKTVMAHCIHCPPEEIDLLKEQGVFVAHCPTSNSNLGSGMAPVRRFLQKGVPVGLGSDIAGGHTLSMPEVLRHAIQVSKLRCCTLDETLPPLTLSEAFYAATAGGGAFFGKTGLFRPGYAFDVLALHDNDLPSPRTLTPLQRLERLLYSSSASCLWGKFVDGKQLF